MPSTHATATDDELMGYTPPTIITIALPEGTIDGAHAVAAETDSNAVNTSASSESHTVQCLGQPPMPWKNPDSLRVHQEPLPPSPEVVNVDLLGAVPDEDQFITAPPRKPSNPKPARRSSAANANQVPRQDALVPGVLDELAAQEVHVTQHREAKRRARQVQKARELLEKQAQDQQRARQERQAVLESILEVRPPVRRAWGASEQPQQAERQAPNPRKVDSGPHRPPSATHAQLALNAVVAMQARNARQLAQQELEKGAPAAQPGTEMGAVATVSSKELAWSPYDASAHPHPSPPSQSPPVPFVDEGSSSVDPPAVEFLAAVQSSSDTTGWIRSEVAKLAEEIARLGELDALGRPAVTLGVLLDETTFAADELPELCKLAKKRGMVTFPGDGLGVGATVVLLARGHGGMIGAELTNRNATQVKVTPCRMPTAVARA